MPSFAFSLPLSKVANAAVHTFTTSSSLNCSDPATTWQAPKGWAYCYVLLYFRFYYYLPWNVFCGVVLIPQYLLQEVLICTAYTRFDEFFYLYIVYYQSATQNVWSTAVFVCTFTTTSRTMHFSFYSIYAQCLSIDLYFICAEVAYLCVTGDIMPDSCARILSDVLNIFFFFMLIWSSENIINKRRNIFDVFKFLHISFLKRSSWPTLSLESVFQRK